MTKVFKYPNTAPGSRMDWIEFIMSPKQPNENTRLYRVNLSWMLSNWQCTFGSCPGTLVTGAHKDISCCQIGVSFGLYGPTSEKKEEHAFQRKIVHELTPEDWDHGYGNTKPDSFWTEYEPVTKTKSKHKGRKSSGKAVEMVPDRTKVVGGGCIFANRSDGPAGKPGCAFHVLALRTGRHHSETKPVICWMIPFTVSERYDEDTMMDVYEVSGTPAAMWGAVDTSDLEAPGHWCTEIPDHYTGKDPVYQYGEVELRKMLGDDVYEKMAEEIRHAGYRRYEMPGELIRDGRKMLPLLVKNRMCQWGDAGELEMAESAVTWLQEEGGE